MSNPPVRPRLTTLVAVAAALAAAACSSGPEDLTGRSPSAAAPSPATSTSSTPRVLPGPGGSESTGDPRAPLDDLHDHLGDDSSSTSEPGAGRDASAAGRLVVSTWARPDLSAEEWWSDLEPLLSASAREAYGYTDPSIIPALRVSSAQLVPALSSGQTFAVVDVATSLGVVRVNLTRATSRSGWLMDRMDLSEVLVGPPGPGPDDPDVQAGSEPPLPPLPALPALSTLARQG